MSSSNAVLFAPGLPGFVSAQVQNRAGFVPQGPHLMSFASVSGCYYSIFLDFFCPGGRLRATQGPPQAHANLDINLGDIFALLPMQKGSAEQKEGCRGNI